MESPQQLEEVQSMWEVVSIHNFLLTFGQELELKAPSIEDLENGFLAPSQTEGCIPEIYVKLFRGMIYNHRSVGSLTNSTWHYYLRLEIEKRRDTYFSFLNYNPLISQKQPEPTTPSSSSSSTTTTSTSTQTAQSETQPTLDTPSLKNGLSNEEDYSEEENDDQTSNSTPQKNPPSILTTTIGFYTLPPKVKVRLLKAICDLKLEEDPRILTSKRIHNDTKGDAYVEAQLFRIEPIGYDSENNAYYYFKGNEYRLYREKPPQEPTPVLKRKSTPVKPKPGRKRGRPSKASYYSEEEGEEKEKESEEDTNNNNSDKQGESTSTELSVFKDESGPSYTWELVCGSKEQWENLASKLQSSKNYYDKSLFAALNKEILPRLRGKWEEREKIQRRLQHRQLLSMQPKKMSARLASKETQRLENQKIEAEKKAKEAEEMKRIMAEKKAQEEAKRMQERLERMQKRNPKFIQQQKERSGRYTTHKDENQNQNQNQNQMPQIKIRLPNPNRFKNQLQNENNNNNNNNNNNENNGNENGNENEMLSENESSDNFNDEFLDEDEEDLENGLLSMIHGVRDYSSEYDHENSGSENGTVENYNHNSNNNNNNENDNESENGTEYNNTNDTSAITEAQNNENEDENENFENDKGSDSDNENENEDNNNDDNNDFDPQSKDDNHSTITTENGDDPAYMNDIENVATVQNDMYYEKREVL